MIPLEYIDTTVLHHSDQHLSKYAEDESNLSGEQVELTLFARLSNTPTILYLAIGSLRRLPGVLIVVLRELIVGLAMTRACSNRGALTVTSKEFGEMS